MPPYQLVADRARDRVEVEVPGLHGHARVKDHLQ
jgi:hypothetical protein